MKYIQNNITMMGVEEGIIICMVAMVFEEEELKN